MSMRWSGKKKRSRPVAELVFVATAPSRRAAGWMRLDRARRLQCRSVRCPQRKQDSNRGVDTARYSARRVHGKIFEISEERMNAGKESLELEAKCRHREIGLCSHGAPSPCPSLPDHLSRKAPVRLAARGSYSAVLSGAARRHVELKREISYYSC